MKIDECFTRNALLVVGPKGTTIWRFHHVFTKPCKYHDLVNQASWKINELPRVANRAVAFNTSSGPSVPFPPMGTAWQQTVTADLTSAVAKGSRLHPTLSGFDSGCLEKHMWEESEEASAVYNSLMWCHNLPPLLMAVCWRIVYLLIPMLGPIYARLLLTFWGPKKGPFCRVVLLQFP